MHSSKKNAMKEKSVSSMSTNINICLTRGKKKSNLCEEHEAQSSGCVTYTVNGREKSASHLSHFTAREVAGAH